MKLIMKTRNSGKIADNAIKIGKASISFKGSPCDRLNFNQKKENYASLGFDEKNNLCIFYSDTQQDGFLKVYKPRHTVNYHSISVNGSNKEIIKPYRGSYEIAEITVEDYNLNILKARLIKLN